MFDCQIEELYKYHTKKELKSNFSVISVDRKNPVFYDFGKVKYVLKPVDYPLENLNDIENLIDNNYTRIMFVNRLNVKRKSKIMIRMLNPTDKTLFDQFLNDCSISDKEEGMVSLTDNDVYGAIVNGKIVSVASTWYWGDILADIGALTHPDYRGRGFSKETVTELMVNVDKKFIWRCDNKNIASFNLGVSIGFIPSGKIYSFK